MYKNEILSRAIEVTLISIRQNEITKPRPCLTDALAFRHVNKIPITNNYFLLTDESNKLKKEMTTLGPV